LKGPRRQRGIALLTAIVLVSLATILAVSIAFGTALTARRSASTFTVEQGLEVGRFAEAVAAELLADDARKSTGPSAEDTPRDTWAQNYPATEVAPDVTLEAQLLDDSGKFNLNSLVDAQGQPDKASIAIFERLLEAVDVDKRLAQYVVDWIDPEQTTSGGAEDDTYTRLQPGYRTPDGWITSVSELMALPELGREKYLQLLPYVTALPPSSRTINVCFAGDRLLDAVEGALTGSAVQTNTRSPQALVQGRAGTGCFPSIAALTTNTTLVGADKTAMIAKLSTQSTYFRLQTRVSIGTTRFALYSLLERQGPQVSLVYRTFGTE
jgi:general secretion pathway protein K